MKLKDIVGNGPRRAILRRVKRQEVVGISPSREVEDLMRADASGLVMNCPLLATDEIELADSILSHLNSDPKYCPAPIVLQAIQGINARVQSAFSITEMSKPVP